MKGKGSLIWLAWAGAFFVAIFIFGAPILLKVSYVASNDEALVATVSTSTKKTIRHTNTPQEVKALYMTACVAGTKDWRNNLVKLIEETELNSVVIDIKDATGVITFVDPELQGSVSKGCKVADLVEFIQELHSKDIYVIGRISVFQDPLYTSLHPELAVKNKLDGSVWKDKKGLSFIDVGAKPYWDHIVNIANKSYQLGFDEINFDYIRYPSDGNMLNTDFTWSIGTSTKSEMLESFFKYLHEKLRGTGVVTSADLFGMTTTVSTDMNIGQIFEKALPYFDYIAPMVYPSHYPPGWNGFSNPAAYPYEVIKVAVQGAILKENSWRFDNSIATSTPSKVRPWLQDFDLGADYGPEEVRAQIRAANELGINSWMLWSASNKYTESALLPE